MRGFTLLELLIVLAIIGILTTISLTTIADARAKAKDARRRGDIANLRLGLFLYADTSGQYPAPASGVGAGPDQSVDGVGIWSLDPTTNPLVPEAMAGRILDPVNTTKYFYSYDTNSDYTAYVLCATLESFASAGRFLVFQSSGLLTEEPSCPLL